MLSYVEHVNVNSEPSVFLLFTRLANVVQLFTVATVVIVHSFPIVVNVIAACGVRPRLHDVPRGDAV